MEGRERAVDEEFAGPVEKIAFAGIHVRGDFEFVGGGDEIAVFFFDLGEQIVEFGRVFFLQEVLHDRARWFQAPGEQVGEGEIVTVVVGGRIDMLRFLEERRGVSNFSGTNVNFAKIVVGVEIFRLELHRFAELLFGWTCLSQAHQIGGQIGPGRGGIWIESNGFLEVFVGFGVLGLGGINQAEQLVNVEAFRNARKQLFQFRGGFGEMPGVVLGDGRLKFAVEAFVRCAALRVALTPATRMRRGQGYRAEVSHEHDLNALASDTDAQAVCSATRGRGS